MLVEAVMGKDNIALVVVYSLHVGTVSHIVRTAIPTNIMWTCILLEYNLGGYPALILLPESHCLET